MVNKMMMMNVLVTRIALATMLQTTQAEMYYVGDDMGWTIPPNGADDYSEWADEHKPLYVYDDSIVFDFRAGEQDVALVTEEDFDSCTTTNPVWYSSDPDWVNVADEGTYHFIGTFAGHCEKGQKIALTFTKAPPSSMTRAHCPSPSSFQVNSTNAKLPRKFLSKRVGRDMNKKIVYLNKLGAISK